MCHVNSAAMSNKFMADFGSFHGFVDSNKNTEFHQSYYLKRKLTHFGGKHYKEMLRNENGEIILFLTCL